ncbi:unnamed protein product [Cylindrotheca closterium]|uniref:Uncharacterized protein n=1 Tax=Cylindrotheca closterium TaxID=2856 RepID=A0AAD2JLX2_9STRA|nr:unnamed protein product [Cylindrotheca closterium]
MADNDNNNHEETILVVFTSNTQRQDIPRNVTSVRVHVQVLPVWALSKLPHLETVEFPMGFRVIGKSAFLGCTSLQELALPLSAKEIRAGAMAGCMKLKTVQLNEGLEDIMDAAFQHCRSLTHIIIPPTVETLGNLLFHGCHSLCLVNLPEGLQFLGRSVFMQCHSLQRIYVPCTVNYIGAYCFKDCFQLQSIELPPSGLKMIRVEAFCRCSNLRNICISPGTVLEGGYDRVFDQDSLLLCKEDDNIPNLDLDLDFDPEFLENENIEWSTPKAEKAISIQNRYQDLPILRLCYYQAHWSSLEEDSEGGTNSIVEEMERLIKCHCDSRTKGDLDTKVAPKTTTSTQDHVSMTPLHILALSAKPNRALWNLVYCAFPGDLLVKDKWGKEPLQYLLECSSSIENDFSIEHILQVAIPERLQCRLRFLGEQWRNEFLQRIHDLPMDGTRATRRNSANQILTLAYKYERMEAVSLLESAVWKAQWQRMVEPSKPEPKVTAKAEEKLESTIPPGSSHDLTTITARETCRLQCRSEAVVCNVMQFLDPLLQQLSLEDPIAQF